MTTHVAIIHEKNKPFKCELFDYRCGQNGDMKKHVATVHDKKKPFKCEICGYTFALKADMKRHVQSVHYSDVKYVTISVHEKMK